RRHAKDAPPVVRLDDIGAIVLEQTAHHDVAALVEPCGHGGRITEHGAGEQLQPGPSGVDEDAGGGYVAPAPHVEHEAPCDAPLCLDAAGAGADYGAALGGVERAEHDETRVVREAIRIFEAVLVAPLERRAERVICEVDGSGRRKDLPPAEVIVDEQPEAQHPLWTQARLARQHEAHGPDEVWGHAQHYL